MITELVIGYLYPGKPLANVAFKTYGYISMAQAINFVGDFKLGHYMKVPPRSMFAAQVSIVLDFQFSPFVFSVSSFIFFMLFFGRKYNAIFGQFNKKLKYSWSPDHSVFVR